MDKNCHIPDSKQNFLMFEIVNLIASVTSYLYDSRINFPYIDNDVWPRQTEKVVKNFKNKGTTANDMLLP